VHKNSPDVGAEFQYPDNHFERAIVDGPEIDAWFSGPPTEGPPGAGAYCLSFSASVEGKGSLVSDKLQSRADLARWLVGIGLAAEPCVVAIPMLRRARDLREAIRRLLLAARRDEPLPAVDRLTVNTYARQPRVRWQLTADWRREPYAATDAVEAALATIVVDAVNVLTRLLQARRRVRGCW